MKRIILFLLSIAALYILTYLGVEVIPFTANPLDPWYSIPTMLILIVGVFASLMSTIAMIIKK